MSAIIQHDHVEFRAWIERAKQSAFEQAVLLCGFIPAKGLNKRHDQAGPCPSCGGRDRFAINSKNRLFNCRGCGIKGRDALALALVGNKVSFIDACELLTGETYPRPKRQETPETRHAREQLRRAQVQRAQEERALKEKIERERERRRLYQAHRLWEKGRDWQGTIVEDYLKHRRVIPPSLSSSPLKHLPLQNLRFLEHLDYFHDEITWAGPVMLARIQDATGNLLGVHRTWIDPHLSTKKGQMPLFCPRTKCALSTKKVLGNLRSGVVRLVEGDEKLSFSKGNKRLFLAEGMETLLTAYFSLHGASSAHLVGSAFWCGLNLNNLANIIAPEWVRDVVLLGDGDSDHQMTYARLLRAKENFQDQKKRVQIVMAPTGFDFNDLVMRAA